MAFGPGGGREVAERARADGGLRRLGVLLWLRRGGVERLVWRGGRRLSEDFGTGGATLGPW